MILIVDDDPLVLDELKRAIENNGFAVMTADSGVSALDIARQYEPLLIVSDIRMPEMSGLEFQSKYRKRFPTRETPIVFLSSVTDENTMVQGIDQGAEDYVTKPVSPTLLIAKIRAVLRRKRKTISRAVRGNLSDIPFTSVVRSCELKGLTGVLELQVAEGTICIRFRAGVLDEQDAQYALERVQHLDSGWFTIRSEMPDFRDLRDMTVDSSSSPSVPSTLLVGRLSAISLSNRLFQIETESVAHDPGNVVTMVTVEGKTLWKRSSRLASPISPQALAQRVDVQHEQVERYVQHKLDAALHEFAQPAADSENGAGESSSEPTDVPPPSVFGPASVSSQGVASLKNPLKNRQLPERIGVLDDDDNDDVQQLMSPLSSDKPFQSSITSQVYKLSDDGYEHFRKGDYALAIDCWEQALRLDPHSEALKVNLKVAKQKAEQSQNPDSSMR